MLKIDNIGLFQIIYTKYMTSTNKERIKKEFIFLESFNYKNSIECVELYRVLNNRYKQYNNIIMLEYNKRYNGYLFHKTRFTTLLLKATKGELQKGEKINIELLRDVII